LIVVQGVHQAIPEVPPANAPVYLGTPPPAATGEQTSQPTGPAGTDADKLVQKYKQIGAAENHKFGEGGPGTKPPDFNLKIPAPGAASPPDGQLPAKPKDPLKPDGTAKAGVAVPPRRPVPASPAAPGPVVPAPATPPASPQPRDQ
jgi:hypothetical protein